MYVIHSFRLFTKLYLRLEKYVKTYIELSDRENVSSIQGEVLVLIIFY